ncbi:MFS transporter [Streptomyces decoyicus]|uniref:MFS transporter n=1 Tax=Streptomyces decoyicus TaxID=249567 RepID=UPI00339DBF2C
MPSDGSVPAGATGGIWRHRHFALLWTGETVSQVGTAVTSVSLPLVALGVLHSNAFVVGALTAAVWLPWLVVGLHAGAWVDRLPRRPLMLICDTLSALLLISVPTAAWNGVLTVPHLLVVAFLTGVCGVFRGTAYQVFLPAVVGDEELLSEANAKSQAGETSAGLGGPPLGGVLAQSFGAVVGLLADAVSFVVSIVCLLAIRVDDRPKREPGPRAGMGRDIREGLTYTAADPYLRPLTLYSAAANLSAGAFLAVALVFLVDTVGIAPGVAGLLMAAGGVGGIIGAMAANRIARAWGTAYGMLLCELCAVPFILLVPLTSKGPGAALFVIGTLGSAIGTTASNVIIRTFKQRYVPRHLLGRTTAIARCLAYGTVPVGALLGGSLASLYGAREAVWISSAAQVLCLAVLLPGPIRRSRDLPAAAPAHPVPGTGRAPDGSAEQEIKD